MKVTKFTYDNPDSDGRVSLEAEGVIENKSVHDVEYITTSYILVNEAGVTVGGGDTYLDDAFIESKSSGDISFMSWDSVDSGKINGSGENLKAYFEATTYKREFVKVGTMDFPQKVGDLVQLKKIVSLGGVADLMGVSAYRNKDTDEGECDVDMQIAIKNTSDTFFSRVQVTTKLVDQRDAELADDLSFDALPPHSSKIFTPWLYSLKPGKIKNAEYNITASVFIPIESFTIEAEPVKSED
tara:strand:+ start:86 stop:808 length:723 start_codon:yes stop_codon:yes gene_type:complete